MNQGRVLIIDDDQRIAKMLSQVFAEYGLEPLLASTGSQGLAVSREEAPDAVLLDLRLPDMGGMEVLKSLHDSRPQVPVIIFSAHGDIKTAVEAVKLGAFDFIEKPVSTERLLLTVQHAIEQRRLRGRVESLEIQAGQQYRITGSSPSMDKVFNLIKRASEVRANVLIFGENGTGKELAARAIHYGSPRREQPFVKINCAAIPETLLESELFGYEKGSFTGANTAKKGKLESANLGTVLLDEIGDMTLATQSKLLRFMQEGEIEKIGSIHQQHLDVRIIAATNQDLETAVREKRFREDLYYRLNVLPIRMPPLRERPEDIPALAIQFINEFCQQNGVVEKILADQTLAYLSRQPWPGNVRQLRNMMERVVALVDRQMIEPSDIEEIMQSTSVGGKCLVPDNFQDAKHHFEREYIVGVLNSNKWNILRTANQLGMDRANLYRKMKKLGIEDKRSPKTDVI
mgnify:CR=1 FL=1